MLRRLFFTIFLALNLIPHAHTEEGLFRVKDTKVPGVIEIASESVLQIVLHGETPREIPAAFYDNFIAGNAGEDFIAYLSIEKIKKCKANSLPKCTLNYSSMGSAFLTDNSNILWTAKHVIDPQLNKKLSFELYTRDGEKVFDTSDSKDQAQLNIIGNGMHIQDIHKDKLVLDDGFKQLSSDYARIQLNRSLAIRALRISKRKPQINERLFAAGYANVSAHRRLSTQGGNVITRSRVAIGVMRPYNEVKSNMSAAEKQANDAVEGFVSRHLLVMEMDGLPGQSGSPVFNESGEVVGIFVAGNSTIQNRGALRGLAPHFEGIALNGHSF